MLAGSFSGSVTVTSIFRTVATNKEKGKIASSVGYAAGAAARKTRLSVPPDGLGHLVKPAMPPKKPTMSAWVVNQLYWKHNEAFMKLMKSGDRLLRLQISQLAGKADVHLVDVGDSAARDGGRRDGLRRWARRGCGLGPREGVDEAKPQRLDSSR